MKNLKVLGLAALATAALMAFAGSASATTVSTTTGGAAATPTIHAVSEGHTKLQNPIAIIECASTLEGKVESHGAGIPASGSITNFTLTPCTNSWHKTTTKLGSLQVHWTSGHNGVLTSSGVEVQATRFFVPCNYGTNNTEVGAITGGNPATIHIKASLPILPGSSELCGGGSFGWTGSYQTTTALYVAS
jgi:hypothetical protein